MENQLILILSKTIIRYSVEPQGDSILRGKQLLS